MVEWVVLVFLVYAVLGSNPLIGKIFFLPDNLRGVRRRAEIVRRSSAAESEVYSQSPRVASGDGNVELGLSR